MENMEQTLKTFIGTTQYFQHWLGMRYTDGVHYLVENGECHWLLDIVASYRDRTRDKPFVVWTLDVNEDNTAVVTAKEDSGMKPFVTQKLNYTDFKEQTGMNKIELWLENGVLILPSEH